MNWLVLAVTSVGAVVIAAGIGFVIGWLGALGGLGRGEPGTLSAAAHPAARDDDQAA